MSRDTASQTPRRKYAARVPVDERREQLLDAALTVLARDGFDNVTIEAISKEAGVTRPVVYSAYDGLEPLLHALLDRTRNRALAQAMQVLVESGTPEDVDTWIVTAIDGLIEQVVADPDVWRPVLGVTRGAPAVVRDRIEETRELIRGYLEAGIETGIQLRGGPDVDSRILSHVVLVMAEEFGRLILEDPPRYSRERMVDAVAGFLRAAPPPAP
ncbi:TetR/AcrR family transcriptional regulator [Nocardioides jiangxiensis]|uniref:TetR/AcrR family transcriptional regulator n=1 Tax=Nocardioides jiangxiensis TaxID=3064524 RepID=A0ABT9B2H9_9ACTN|nr:TetR/AcrR family transcriptional regulator [Nocardioides sp. WY-20]MDO7868898.1 TetR/AcrR family transcriptional regulator [Nocardioides sp. WY-20]